MQPISSQAQVTLRTGGLADRALIRSIAELTWPSTYGHAVSQEQIDFMLGWMYSDASLATHLEDGGAFYIASINNEAIGFCAVSADTFNDIPNSHKLNKLYVLPATHRSGAGSALLNQAIEFAKANGSTSLFLQVNKHNNAYDFYVKKGFVKEGDYSFDIGNGFIMDDYVMRLLF
jgi:ribosomal protein S18 acetylase RimI-like enzyme